MAVKIFFKHFEEKNSYHLVAHDVISQKGIYGIDFLIAVDSNNETLIELPAKNLLRIEHNISEEPMQKESNSKKIIHTNNGLKPIEFDFYRIERINEDSNFICLKAYRQFEEQIILTDTIPFDSLLFINLNTASSEKEYSAKKETELKEDVKEKTNSFKGIRINNKQ